MTLTRRSALGALLLCAAAVATPGPRAVGRADLPARVSDQEFWRLIQQYSEPGGTFHSDNFVSNEGRFQLVIPELVARVPQGQLYLGVGPEQNFTYIAAVRPRMAFIVDIRRGNLQEHLLYKALFELSADRADFLARLFSRTRPARLGPTSRAEQLFAAFDAVPADEAQYRANLDAVIAHLTVTRRLPLSTGDRAGIDYIYRSAFFADGPDLGYRLTGAGRNTQHPTYAELMAADDGQGAQRSYLATEDNYRFVRALQQNNLIVPVVGDFAGTRALRSIGQYARSRRARVATFYLSNVEQYLRQDGKTAAFCANVAALPIDESSTFIRSTPGRNAFGGPTGRSPGLGMFWLALGRMQAETAACTSRSR